MFSTCVRKDKIVIMIDLKFIALPDMSLAAFRGGWEKKENERYIFILFC